MAGAEGSCASRGSLGEVSAVSRLLWQVTRFVLCGPRVAGRIGRSEARPKRLCMPSALTVGSRVRAMNGWS